MRGIIFFIAACGLVAIIPILPFQSGVKLERMAGPQWPTHFNGNVLKKVSLSEREKIFEYGFPGKIARFTDGQREIVLKWLTQPTRKLHPASDCFKGMGFAIKPMPVWVDKKENRWGCFRAVKGNQNICIIERIYDESGHSWNDVSSWYWSALLGKTSGPWWAVTVSEKTQMDPVWNLNKLSVS
jgi:hypothetical protein